MTVPIELGWPTRDTSKQDLGLQRHPIQREKCQDKQPQMTNVPVKVQLPSSTIALALYGSWDILPLFQYSEFEKTGRAVPQPAGVKLLSCDAKVCISCHGTFGTWVWRLCEFVKKDILRDLCRAEDDKTEMVLQGERCLEQTLPKIIPEDRQSV